MTSENGEWSWGFELQNFFKCLPAKRPPKSVKGMHVGRGSRLEGEFFFLSWTLAFLTPHPLNLSHKLYSNGSKKTAELMDSSSNGK
jgi:hypothetical protein